MHGPSQHARPAVPSTADLDARVLDAVRALRAHTSVTPRIGITLGSGLGSVVDAVDDGVVVATGDLPHWPRSTVTGHAGRLAVGHWEDVPVVMLSGRTHRYEGHSLDRVTFAPRVMRALGADTLLFTNAVGAIHPDYLPGDVMLALDHVNFIGKRGLLTTAELAARRLGRSASPAHGRRLHQALLEAAGRVGVTVRQGVLLGGLGPSYETAAEIRMAAWLGADAVCMSTVHEITVASELGCETASLSCITNRATGLAEAPLTHAEVTRVADRAAARLRAILSEYLRHEAGRRA